MKQSPTNQPTGPGVDRLFRLNVLRATGQCQHIEIEARDEVDASRRAVARGFKVLAVESLSVSRPERNGRFPIVLFTQELLALLQAGLNLTEALSTLLNKERRPVIRNTLAGVVQGVNEGRSFSDVLEHFPHHFPDFYVATVRACEKTGDIANGLARYVAYETQFDTLRRKLVSALIYPALLLVVGVLVTLFLLAYVVPRMAVVYESTGRDLPWMSQLLLDVGRLIHANLWTLLACTLAICGSLVLAVARPAGRVAVRDALIAVPGLSQKALEFRLARVYRATGLLLSSGIALPQALRMAGGLLALSHRMRLARACELVEQGHSLSSALISQQLASPVAESLIKVGERSGQLASMLERTAQFHDEELSRWIDWAMRLVEPLLMLLLGLLIGGVVVLLYMPIFDLAGALQ